eukprot:scaffold2257_cov131-Alexandrium_tamarense.AAC.4
MPSAKLPLQNKDSTYALIKLSMIGGQYTNANHPFHPATQFQLNERCKDIQNLLAYGKSTSIQLSKLYYSFAQLLRIHACAGEIDGTRVLLLRQVDDFSVACQNAQIADSAGYARLCTLHPTQTDGTCHPFQRYGYHTDSTLREDTLHHIYQPYLREVSL